MLNVSDVGLSEATPCSMVQAPESASLHATPGFASHQLCLSKSQAFIFKNTDNNDKSLIERWCGLNKTPTVQRPVLGTQEALNKY